MSDYHRLGHSMTCGCELCVQGMKERIAALEGQFNGATHQATDMLRAAKWKGKTFEEWEQYAERVEKREEAALSALAKVREALGLHRDSTEDLAEIARSVCTQLKQSATQKLNILSALEQEMGREVALSEVNVLVVAYRSRVKELEGKVEFLERRLNEPSPREKNLERISARQAEKLGRIVAVAEEPT